MAAIIHGALHIDVDELEGTEEQKIDKFAKLWGRASYYVKIVNQVKFS